MTAYAGLVTFAVTTTLALAANTFFGSLPVLASVLAQDNYLPHVFALRDDRQVFAPGIWVVVVAVPGFMVLFDRLRKHRGGQVAGLIPLIVPSQPRHRLQHNHLGTVLSARLQQREDAMVARVPRCWPPGGAAAAPANRWPPPLLSWPRC